MFGKESNIRGEGEVCEYTKEQIAEVIRCKEDIIYFGQQYFYIVTTDEGLKKIPLRQYQKKILKNLVDPPDGKRNCAILQPRQSGKCVCDCNVLIRNKLDGSIKAIHLDELYTTEKKRKEGFKI